MTAISNLLILPLTTALCAAGLTTALATQQPVTSGYPQQDMLTPFRKPTDVYAPPDELFRHLRIMQNIARGAGDRKSFDTLGREVVDDPAWIASAKRVDEIGIDGGMLAKLMRLHRNGLQRDTAFYGMFYVTKVDYVMNLISHIPGEPQRRTREAAFPRAIEFLRVHLPRRFGDLPDEQRQAVLQSLPEIGSPAAKARGLTRVPQDGDHLHGLHLVPFLQMLDLEEAIDQAQAIWFLKEVFKIRIGLATKWLEPSLPRLRHLLASESDDVRKEVIELFQVIGPKDLAAPPEERDQLQRWAALASKHLFPPIRNLNDAVIQLFPSEERDAIAAAGIAALENSAIGDPYRAQDKEGKWFSGFKVGRVPAELKVLAIPVESVITTINGMPVRTGPEVLEQIRQHCDGPARRLFVEYVHKGTRRAIEYRVM